MQYAFQQHMTQAMVDVLLTEEEIITEYELAVTKHNEAFDAADITLPATAVDGGLVQHGARMSTKTIVQYWKDRVDAIKWFLPASYRSRREDLLILRR